jgi:hypothetical protein
MSPFHVVLHHGEAIDPTLIDWLRHKIDDIVGVGPVPIVMVLGVVIVAFPIVLAILAARRREGNVS